VTNLAEYLAAEVIATHFPHRFEEEIPVIWIEHYPPRRANRQRSENVQYSFVDFDSYTPRRAKFFGRPRVRIGDPAWRNLEVGDVERIVGQTPI
jgi:hypothetical protein